MSSPLEVALGQPASSSARSRAPASSSPTAGRAGALPPLAAALGGAEQGTSLAERLKQKKSSKERGNKIAPLVVAPAAATSTTQAATSSSNSSWSPKPAASPSSAAAASKYAAGGAATEGEKGEQRKQSSGNDTAATVASSSAHTIRVHADHAVAASTPMISESELLSEIDRTIDLYPLLEETHLENRVLLEPLLAYVCCCCLSSRSQRSLLRSLHEWLSNFLPLLSLLWLISMVGSLLFLVDLLPSSYLPALVFSGVYPLVRLCFASIPVLRLLLGSFETWFLLIQAALLVAAFGALSSWDLRFAFVLGCLLPSIVQIILLDANYSSSVLFTSLAMAFGALYISSLALLLGTGQIVSEDIVLDLRWFRVGLTDFCIQRLITLMLFSVKNICMLLSEPQAYLGVYGLVSRKPVVKEAIQNATTNAATTNGSTPAATATSAAAAVRPSRRKDKTQQELRWTKTRRSLV